jgi:hypothetical protein
VTIERAGKATYAKVEDEEGGVIRASGGVVLTLVEENGDTHRIEADTVAYDRARSTLTAQGSVRYERKSGSTVEVFTGDTLSADLDDWSGVFLNGTFRRAGSTAAAAGTPAPGAAPTTAASGVSSASRGLVISADTILRRTTDVMVLKDGVITASEAADPYYAIRAGRVWILGDKELAMSDALFSVGNVPILWLPFFYYPGDELVFHPVIGYRTRTGRFVQTTTYLIGAKPPQTTGSIISFQDNGPAQPTELKGLYLRTVKGPPPKDVGTLKFLADAYSSLGVMTALQGDFPKLGPLGKTSLFTAVARTRTIYPPGTDFDMTDYSPYSSLGNYQSQWNDSDFLGLSFPLRYVFDLSTAIQAGPLNASLALPIYSDTYFNTDFRDRTEDMDWFQLLTSSADTSTPPGQLSQLQPKLALSMNATPKILGSWLSSVNISNLSAWMNLPMSTQPNTNRTANDPNYYFFYPSIFRPLDFTATIGGTLFGSPPAPAPPTPPGTSTNPAGTQPAQATQPAAPAAPSPTASPAPPPASAASKPPAGPAPILPLRSPWEEEGGSEAPPTAAPTAAAQATSPAAPAQAAGNGGGPALGSPELTQGFRVPPRAADSATEKEQAWTGSGTWSISPSVYDELRYNYDSLNSPWVKPEDIDYSLNYDLWSYHIAGTLTGNLAYGDYLTSSLGLTYLDQNLNRTVLDDSNDWENTSYDYKVSDELYFSRRFSESARMSFKPFASSWLWSATSLNYGLDATIFSEGYTADSSGNYYLNPQWMAWTPTMITAHNVGLTLAARPWGQAQSLTFTANLPPELDSYSGNLALGAGVAALTVATGMLRSTPSASYTYNPLTTGLSLGKAPWPALTDTLVYNYAPNALNANSAQEGAVSNTTNLVWGPLNASLQYAQTQSYVANLKDPHVSLGWQAYGPTNFAPTKLSLSLAPVWPTPATTTSSAAASPAQQATPAATLASGSPNAVTWSLSPNLTLSQSLVECSQASLTFGLTASLKIGNQFSLSITSQSSDIAVWRYYAFLFPNETGQVPYTYTDKTGTTQTAYDTISFNPSDYQISNPLQDLWDSLSFWDTSALTRGNFKLSSLSVAIAQDLRDWTLSLTASTTPVFNSTDNTYHLDTSISINLAWKDLAAMKSAVAYNSYPTPTTPPTPNLTY